MSQTDRLTPRRVVVTSVMVWRCVSTRVRVVLEGTYRDGLGGGVRVKEFWIIMRKAETPD